MCDSTFLAWCKQHNITTYGVQPGFVSEGWRGVVATQQLQPNTLIMAVPDALLMSVMSAKRDAELASVLGQHQLSSHQILAIHLLHEASKGPASFWQPYLRQLPTSYTNCMCWQPSAVDALQLLHAQAAAQCAIDKARREWDAARLVLQDLGLQKKWCSWRAWCWAASGVLSRTMYHPDDSTCGCLTPLGDLHNYAPPPPPYTPDVVASAQRLVLPAGSTQGTKVSSRLECIDQDLDNTSSGVLAGSGNGGCHAAADTVLCGDGHYDRESQLYKIMARQSYSEGEQVFLCYGRHANLDLLELYGFMLQDNPHETALLPVELLQHALQQQRQQQHRLQQGERQWRRQPQQQQGPVTAPQLDVCASDCYIHLTGQPSWQLLKALRLAAASPAEVKAKSHQAFSGEPISSTSEITALCSLQAACQAQLSSLPTTLQEDEALLACMKEAADAADMQGMSAEQHVGAPTAVSSSNNNAKHSRCADGMASAEARQQGHAGSKEQEEDAKDAKRIHQKQQQQQEQACMQLAISWRVCYKQMLLRCIGHCQQALEVLAHHKPSEGNRLMGMHPVV